MQFHRAVSKAPTSSSLADFPTLSGTPASTAPATLSQPVDAPSPDLVKLIELCDENIATYFKKKGKVAPYNASARFLTVFEAKKGAKLLQSTGLSNDDAISKIVDSLKGKYHHHVQKDGSHYFDTKPSNRGNRNAKGGDDEEDDNEDENVNQVSESLHAASLINNSRVGETGTASSSSASAAVASSSASSSFWSSNSLASKKTVSDAEFGLTANHTDSAIALRELIALCRVKVDRFDFKKGKDRFDATLSFEKVFQTKQGTDLLAASGLGTDAAVDQIVHAVKGDYFAFVDNSHYFLALERPNGVAKKSSINDMRLDTSKKKLTK